MENRIYYGEYSLKHWIEMLLKKKITLPEYQRSYVWDEKAVKIFIKSLTYRSQVHLALDFFEKFCYYNKRREEE